MPVIPWLPRKPDTNSAPLPAPRGLAAPVAEEIALIETLDRRTVWPTLRIRSCLRFHAAARDIWSR